MRYRLGIVLFIIHIYSAYAQSPTGPTNFQNLITTLVPWNYKPRSPIPNEGQLITKTTSLAVGKLAVTDSCLQVNNLTYIRRVEQPSPSILYALSGAELIKSLDGGKQWKTLDICDANNAIYADISFPTPLVGYVITRNRPNLFKTVDGGTTWMRFLPKLDDINLEAFSVHFVNDSVGYMLAKPSWFGSYYTLYKTTNGGYSFDKLPNSPHFLLDNFGLYLTQRIKPSFIGSSTIVGLTEIVNNNNSIRDRLAISTDGGVTWQKHLLPIDGTSVNQLYAISADDIWLFARSNLVGGYKNSDDLFHTTDGGTTWTKISLPGRVDDPYRPINIFDIRFTDAQRGIVVGGQYGEYYGSGQRPAAGYLYKTSDGGSSWTILNTGALVEIQLKTLSMRGEQVVVFGVGVDSDNPGRTDRLTLTSATMGVNWERSCDLDYVTPYSIAFRTPKEAYMVGQSKLFRAGIPDNTFFRVNYYHKTNDGGISWKKVYLPETEQLFEVYFLNASNGFLTTQDAVWVTSDGGQNWQRKPTPASFLPLRKYNDNLIHYAEKFAKSYFINTLTWLRISTTNQVFKTSDGGDTWEQLPTPVFTDTPLLSFVNEQIGFCTGRQGSNDKQVYKTLDGGQTWNVMGQISTSDREVSDMVFTDALTGYSYDIAVRITRDGGLTWNTVSSIPYQVYTDTRLAFTFFNKQIGYFGGVYKTIDGGETWSTLPNRQTYAIWPVAVVDESTAYALNTSFRHGSMPCNLVPSSGDTLFCKGANQPVFIQIADGSVSSPLHYQWYKLPENIPIPGQTSATLSLTNVSAYDIQAYYCIATNGCGTTISRNLIVAGDRVVYTLKAGNWADPSIWSCNRIPTSSDRVVLKHAITLSDTYKAYAYRLEFNNIASLRYNGQSKLLVSSP